jgi:hypothetical protein
VAPSKAGIGEIVKFGPPFLVDMDRESFCDFFTCHSPEIFLIPYFYRIWLEKFSLPPPDF